MSYRVDVHKSVDRALKRLPVRVARQIGESIDALSETPRPSGVKKLTGSSFWRLRVGEYRVIYIVFDREQLVIVERLERRTTTTYD